MGWFIGGIVALYFFAKSKTTPVCVAPVAGGTMPLQAPLVQGTCALHVSPSQALVCHATATGCPALPVPSTASEGTVAGGQPVNPLLPVQVANCNHTQPMAVPIVCNGLVRQPVVSDPVQGPSGIDPIMPIIGGTFHCDHIVVSQQVVSPPGSTPGQLLPTGPGQTVLSTGVHSCGTKFSIVQDARGNTFQVNC